MVYTVAPMNRVRLATVLFLSVISVAWHPTSAADDPKSDPSTSTKSNVSFSRQVAPLLVKHCIACHGPKNPEGDFQLHTFARLMKGGSSGEPPIVAKKPEQSYLFELVTSDDAEVRMPKEQKPLAAAEIDLLRRWIHEGAAFDGPDEAASLDSYAPKQVQPAPPEVYPRPVPITANSPLA